MERTRLGSIAGLLGRAARGGNHGDIVVGQVAPLSGTLASTGARMVQGVKVCFDYINATGGVHGRRIQHLVLDDGHSVEDTVRCTRELLQRRELVALIGFGGTMNISQLLADGVLAAGRAPLVAPYCGGEPLRVPFNPWIFHLRASYADEADRIVHREFAKGRRRFALVVSADGLGRAGLDVTRAALAKRNLELTGAGSFARNTEQVEHAVERILAARPEVVILFSTNRTTAAFLRQYRACGGTATCYNLSLLDVAEVVQLAGPEPVRNLYVTQVVPSPAMLSLPAVREFHQLMKRFAPGEGVNYTNFELFLGAKVLAEALRRCEGPPARDSVAAALESISHFDLGGITVDYGPGNRIGSRRVDFTVVGGHGELAEVR
jgi:branched-chain amino acid transport system substrate-binding protein